MGDDKEEQQAITNNPLLDGDEKSGDQAPGQVMDKPKTGRGKKAVVFLLVIVLILAAAGGVYYWQKQKANKQAADLQSQITDLKKQVVDAEKKAKEVESKSNSQSDSTITVQEKEYSIELPSGWEKTTSQTVASSITYTYENTSSGDFFRVAVDTQGDGGADSYWKYQASVAGNSITIVSKNDDCDPQNSVCQKGDGRLVISMTNKDRDNAKIKGHVYWLFAGNTKSENLKADRAQYETIAESIKFK